MSAEVGTIQVEANSKEQLEELLKIYNSFMKENANDDHDDLSEDDIDYIQLERFDPYYSFEEDSYGLFDDPMNTCLFEMVKRFIEKNPEFQFSVIYEMSWDNSGETWSEEYKYEDRTLRMETIFEPDSGDEDDEEEDDTDEGTQVTNRLFKFDGNDLIENKS